MSITIKLDLPEAVAAQARAEGLLESAAISALVQEEIRRRKDQRQVIQGRESKARVRELPADERQKILEQESGRLAGHYQQPSDWDSLASEGLDD
jgi:post-segregation antitoxin (ccd killing protein)